MWRANRTVRLEGVGCSIVHVRERPPEATNEEQGRVVNAQVERATDGDSLCGATSIRRDSRTLSVPTVQIDDDDAPLESTTTRRSSRRRRAGRTVGRVGMSFERRGRCVVRTTGRAAGGRAVRTTGWVLCRYRVRRATPTAGSVRRRVPVRETRPPSLVSPRDEFALPLRWRRVASGDGRVDVPWHGTPRTTRRDLIETLARRLDIGYEISARTALSRLRPGVKPLYAGSPLREPVLATA
jgi:hypothetical protein